MKFKFLLGSVVFLTGICLVSYFLIQNDPDYIFIIPLIFIPLIIVLFLYVLIEDTKRKKIIPRLAYTISLIGIIILTIIIFTMLIVAYFIGIKNEGLQVEILGAVTTAVFIAGFEVAIFFILRGLVPENNRTFNLLDKFFYEQAEIRDERKQSQRRYKAKFRSKRIEPSITLSSLMFLCLYIEI